MSSYQYRKSHCGDKTVVRSSYLHNGISYAGKMVSLYWIGALVVISFKTQLEPSHISHFSFHMFSTWLNRLGFPVMFFQETGSISNFKGIMFGLIGSHHINRFQNYLDMICFSCIIYARFHKEDVVVKNCNWYWGPLDNERIYIQHIQFIL